MKRSCEEKLKQDLEKKIVLLAGPRQVGKTTISKQLFSKFEYLNFDNSEHRKIIMKRSWNKDTDLIVFDELHKKKGWKTWIKGIYDTEGINPKILVTGSARLDIYRKGGDSLAGRHYLHRLHPFSIAELKNKIPPKEVLETLLLVGGFPEPFLSGSESEAKRWRSTQIERILKEDLLDLEPVRQIKSIEILVDLLSDRVGSTISYSSLARDLEVSPHSVKKWIQILETMYVIFTVTPYTNNIARSILKEPKVYFYDIGRIKKDPGARFENLVALALLKDLHKRQDYLGERCNLHYLRDKEKREVDFLIEIDRQIHTIVEAKTSDSNVSKNLRYFKNKLQPKKSIQVVKSLRMDQEEGGIKIADSANWLAQLENI